MNIFEIIDEGIKNKASDIHLTKDIRPSLRIDGVLRAIDKFEVLNDTHLNEFGLDILGEKRFEQLKEDNNIDLSMSYKEQRLRVHIYKQMGSLAYSLRLIPMEIPRLEDLSLPDIISKLTEIKDGLVLITGVTGSGKSTTLASIINKINEDQSKHIITVEDPIEYIHKHNKSIINQREVGSDVSSFANAVKDAMREDPDILLLGELRDLDTIQNAITMAETGHLVFGTLHTRSASETPDRIIDVFPANQQEQIRVQFANAVKAIVSQELIPKKDGGRIANCEILIVNDAVRNIIKTRGNVGEILNVMNSTHKTLGAQTKMKSLALLLKDGVITMDVAKKGLNESEIKELSRLLR